MSSKVKVVAIHEIHYVNGGKQAVAKPGEVFSLERGEKNPRTEQDEFERLESRGSVREATDSEVRESEDNPGFTAPRKAGTVKVKGGEGDKKAAGSKDAGSKDADTKKLLG